MSYFFQYSGFDRPNFIPATGWDFEDDFTDDQTTMDARWTQAGTLTKPNATNDNFDWDGRRSGSNNAMSADPLGAVVSDTAWVMRVKLVMSTLDSASYSHVFGFGLRSINASSDSFTSADSIMGGIFVRHTETAENAWSLEGDDATPWANPQMTARLTTVRPVTGQTRWVEIIRASSTSITLEVFTDAYSTSEQSTGSVTIASTVQNLRYITFQNDNNSTLGTTVNGTGDDVQFANGVTVAPP